MLRYDVSALDQNNDDLYAHAGQSSGEPIDLVVKPCQ